MSWLQSTSNHVREPEVAREPSAEQFAGYTVYVERDLDTGEMVTETINGHQWVSAYATYELLEQARGGFAEDTVDHIQLSGRQLKERLRAKDWPHVGVMWRPNRDVEHAVVWPQAAPVARVSVQ